MSAPPMVEVAPPITTDDQRVARIGYWVIGLAVGIFCLWSVALPLHSAAVAPGLVTVSGNRKEIQHLEGGIVSEILVREGAHVRRGDVLLRLSDVRAGSQAGVIRAQYEALLAEEARLLAERDGLADMVIPDDLARRKDDPAVAAILAGQKNIFLARRANQSDKEKILKQRIAQSKEQIAGFQSQADSNATRIKLLQDEIDNLREAFQKGFVTRARMLDLETEVSRLTGERNSLIANIGRTQEAIGETRLQIVNIDTDFRADVTTKLRETQEKLDNLKERRASADDELARTEIRAPMDGRIVGLAVHTSGGVISPGQILMGLVPDKDVLVVDAQVSPNDIDSVTAGLPAEIRFPAFKRTTPQLRGTVLSISADAMTSKDRDSAYYLAKINVPATELAKLKTLKLVPGMPAEVMIETGQQSAFEYLTAPLGEALGRAFREN